MQVSIEEIGGKRVTVIKCLFNPDQVRESLAMGVPVVAEWPTQRYCLQQCRTGEDGVLYFDRIPAENFTHTITILPALPKHPRPEDAALLYRYMAEELHPACTMDEGAAPDSIIQGWYRGNFWHCADRVEHRTPEITHAILADGTRVDIAITDEGEV